MEVNLHRPGDSLLTLDTGTGLHWLDVTATLSQPYATVQSSSYVSDLGFRFATQQEVESMLLSADVQTVESGAERADLFSPGNSAAVKQLLDKVGCTLHCEGNGMNRQLRGLYDLVPLDPNLANSGSTNISLVDGFLNQVDLFGGEVPKDAARAHGSFLVLEAGVAPPALAAAPLPAAFWLFPFAAAVLAFFRRRTTSAASAGGASNDNQTA